MNMSQKCWKIEFVARDRSNGKRVNWVDYCTCDTPPTLESEQRFQDIHGGKFEIESHFRATEIISIPTNIGLVI